MEQPFLFKFKQPCSTKFEINNKIQYSYENEMVFLTNGSSNIPVIDSKGQNMPSTKKADLEKGEDQKDSLMWK